LTSGATPLDRRPGPRRRRTLRSDNTDVAPMALDPADTVAAAVRRVVRPDEVDGTTQET
jgi:hypothetical protein